MPNDRKKERRGKDKPYVKGTQNEAATRDSDDEPETCCVVIKESTQDGQPGDEAVYCEVVVQHGSIGNVLDSQSRHMQWLVSLNHHSTVCIVCNLCIRPLQ